MSTIAAGTTSTTALVSTGDTTGKLTFQTNGTTTAMTIDTSQNVGIGVTPSAWDTGNSVKALQITSALSLWNYSTNNIYLSQNIYWNGTNRIYTATGTSVSEYSQQNGVFLWHGAGSGTAGNTVSLTERMRIDTSGNVGIGTSSPAANTRLTLSDTNTIKLSLTGGSSQNGLFLEPVSSSNQYYIGAGNSLAVGGDKGFGILDNTNSRFKLYINDGAAGETRLLGTTIETFYTNGSERMRILSGGQVLIGLTAEVSGSGARQTIQWDSSGQQGITLKTSSTTFNGNAIKFVNSSDTECGYIAQTSTTVSYNSASDYRLKENIKPMTNALAKVVALNPVTYKWKLDGSAGEGFLAHELQKIVPSCVTGEKDEVDANGRPKYQGVDTSFLVATLTAAIQELKAEVDALKAQLAKV